MSERLPFGASALTRLRGRGATLRFNWGHVLAFFTFWTYGYYGAITSPNFPLTSVGFTFVSLAIFLFFVLVAGRTASFDDELSVTYSDLIVLLVYFFSLAAVSYTPLRNDIQIDQLYHARAAHIHAITTVTLLAANSAWMSDVTFVSAIRLFDAAILVSLIGLWYLVRRGSARSVVLLSILFVLVRLFVYLTFRGTDPHPQVRLFPIWLGSVALGLNDFGFRSPSVIGIAVLMWVAFRISVERMGTAAAFLLGLACGTIPVLWHTGTLVEPSIWSAVVFTIVVLMFSRGGDKPDIHWTRWFSILSIFFLMRQTVLAALLFAGILFASERLQRRDTSWRTVLSISPVLIMIPVLAKSLYWGTPGSIPSPEITESVAERVWISLSSGASLDILVGTFHWSLIGFLLFAFIPTQLSRAHARRALMFAAFFALLYFMFYAAAPRAWGHGRYQAEYIVPFVVLGIVNVCALLLAVRGGRYWIAAVLIAVTVVNTRSFIDLPERAPQISIQYPAPRTFQAVIVSSVNDYGDILKLVKRDGLAERLFLCDQWTYGVFPHILSGYSISEVRVAQQHFERYLGSVLDAIPVGNGVCSSEAVYDDDEIDLLMVDASRDAPVAEDLVSGMWRDVSARYPSRGNSTYRVFAKQ